uniref:Uncharacterized protein n=1 Tax=Venturia canescens TaxID=32260 RepID=A0A0U1ZLC4_9HYME|nr:hypothetical protein [Venturia canescens]
MSVRPKSNSLAARSRVKSTITPECSHLGKSIKISSTFVIVMIAIGMILMIAALIINSEDDGGRPEDKETKLNGVTITSAVVVGLASLAAIWQFSVAARTVRTCLLKDETM